MKLEIQQFDIGDIQPYEANPRINEQAVEAVKNSIKRFQYLVPIVVDKNNIIVSGHTRYMALQQLGEKSVDVIVAEHMTEQEAAAFRLADNRVAENARWDEDLLRYEMERLKEMGFDLQDTGFTMEEIDCLIDPINADCLDDLSIDIMGKVDTVKSKQQLMVMFSLGAFRFYAQVPDYNKWEKAMLIKHGSQEKVNEVLAKKIGINISYKPSAEEQDAANSAKKTAAA